MWGGSLRGCKKPFKPIKPRGSGFLAETIYTPIARFCLRFVIKGIFSNFILYFFYAFHSLKSLS
ncbi:hypothetical protein HHE02_10850 [Helicobacter heilmannii]|nr:hypothetical protein BN341_8810 [Helicobacter heilmannii ASB1.4]CCM73488.1 hypothetical protein BN341_8840 [Helicobacter heilmannii ASB1.4]CRF47790.1 hypothetical protein HHE02_10850 [Helicobacter heilmannii]CRF50344.1 hypothetical protein HHE06_01680 [Helicobacter heilmannii]